MTTNIQIGKKPEGGFSGRAANRKSMVRESRTSAVSLPRVYPSLRKGEIIGFEGSWSSGLGYLLVKTSRGVERLPCENGATVRALDSAFGGVIEEGHTVNQEAIKGQRIQFEMTDYGVLAGFDLEVA